MRLAECAPAHLFTSTPGSSSPTTCTCLWTLPQDDADFPGRWRAIKTGFARSLPIGEPRSPVMTRRGERGIWQRRYWEHTIRDDRDFAAHMDYTHFNPVKHGLVAHPADWPHSSFPRYVSSGMYPADWRGGSDETATDWRTAVKSKRRKQAERHGHSISPPIHSRGGMRCAVPLYACCANSA
jgi:hypothetical protein